MQISPTLLIHRYHQGHRNADITNSVKMQISPRFQNAGITKVIKIQISPRVPKCVGPLGTLTRSRFLYAVITGACDVGGLYNSSIVTSSITGNDAPARARYDGWCQKQGSRANLCQKLPRHLKKLWYIRNLIRSLNQIPVVYLTYRGDSNEPDLTFLTPCALNLAYLSISLILKLTRTVNSRDRMNK